MTPKPRKKPKTWSLNCRVHVVPPYRMELLPRLSGHVRAVGPERNCCHHRRTDRPTSQSFRRGGWPQRHGWKLGCAPLAASAPGRRSCPHHARPMSLQSHPYGSQQKRFCWLGSAAHLSVLAGRGCCLHQSSGVPKSAQSRPRIEQQTHAPKTVSLVAQ